MAMSTTATRRFTVKVEVRVTDDGTFADHLEALVAQYSGEVISQTFTPTSDDTQALGLNSQLVTRLVRRGTTTVDELAAYNIRELVADLRLDWRAVRDIIRALHDVGRSMKGAPEYDSMIESLELEPHTYDWVRRALAQHAVAPDDGLGYVLIDDIIKLDIIALRELDIVSIGEALEKLGLGIAKTYDSRRVKDLWSGASDALPYYGFPPNMLLCEITPEHIRGLIDHPEVFDLLSILRELQSVGVELGVDPDKLSDELRFVD